MRTIQRNIYGGSFYLIFCLIALGCGLTENGQQEEIESRRQTLESGENWFFVNTKELFGLETPSLAPQSSPLFDGVSQETTATLMSD